MALPNRLICALLACLACAGVANGARAFSSPDAYTEAPPAGGGGGRWFSGSPADGFGCSVCHSGAPSQRVFPLYTAGLPLEGYALATRYEVVLSWPEFARRWTELRPDPMVPAAPGQPVPAEGMVAELVAESGKASGTIEVDTASPDPAQLCEKTRPNLQPRVGVKLYQVRPGVDPLLLRPDSNGLLRCESRHLGQRCLIALTSCGAQQVRFTWTAPPTWEGPVWFSAGFVATEALSGTSEMDSVQEISIPMVQAGTPSGAYQETLRNACALGAGSPPRSFGIGLGVGALALLVSRLRRRTRGTRR
jgi:hypothetical protein